MKSHTSGRHRPSWHDNEKDQKPFAGLLRWKGCTRRPSRNSSYLFHPASVRPEPSLDVPSSGPPSGGPRSALSTSIDLEGAKAFNAGHSSNLYAADECTASLRNGLYNDRWSGPRLEGWASLADVISSSQLANSPYDTLPCRRLDGNSAFEGLLGYLEYLFFNTLL